MSPLKLTHLRLQNFATFETQEIIFNDNFNAIVGETGSGKSLILDALQLILGARADKHIIRKNASFAAIEATFESNSGAIQDYFDNLGFPFDNQEIIIKRVIYSTGKTKAYINHQAANISILSAFSKKFIDLVGQFENQKLLSEDYQMLLLDSYANLKEKNCTYQTVYQKYHQQQSSLNLLLQKQNEKFQRQDFLKYQLDELGALNPSIQDEHELLQQKESLLNYESKRELLVKILSDLSESDGHNALATLNSITSQLQHNCDYISPENLNSLFKAAQLIEEVSYNLSKEVGDESPEQELELIIDRLDQYQRLKRKFGDSTESLVQALHDFSIEYQALAEIDSQILKSEKLLKELKTETIHVAQDLHLQRVKYAKILSDKLTQGVRKLLMKGATINLELLKSDNLGPSGFTRLNLRAETNPGEGFFDLKKVASGGELSRILLTLRQIVASSDSISIFLFDEIDTGIGGETAVCTGKALSEVSKNSQVIAITHLPQIAHQANKLIIIEKSISTENTRTHSLVFEYTGTKKMQYIEKMSQLN